MTTDSTRARWTTRAATTVDLLGALAAGIASGVLLVDHVQYSRVDHPELYGFEIGMSLALGALCGLLGLVLAVAAWRRTRRAWGLAAATWVLACLPVSGLLQDPLSLGETGSVLLTFAAMATGVGANLVARARRHGHPDSTGQRIDPEGSPVTVNSPANHRDIDGDLD